MIDHNMNDTGFVLQNASGNQSGCGSGDRAEAAPDVRMDHQISRARFVFDRGECDAACGAGMLSDQHDAGHMDSTIRRTIFQLGSTGEAKFVELRAE